MSLAQQMRTQCPGLSLPDCFALSCARRPDHVLVTSDKLLRAEAQTRLGLVYELLWVLDQMESSGAISATLLHEGFDSHLESPALRAATSGSEDTTAALVVVMNWTLRYSGPVA